MGGMKMVYYENYLISVIHLSDGSFLSNSSFIEVGGDFNFYQDINKPFSGLKIMNRHIIRDAKKKISKDNYTIEEEVLSIIPWSQIIRLEFDEISKLNKDTLKLLSIEEDEDVPDVLPDILGE